MEENIIYSFSNLRTSRYNFIFVKEICQNLPFFMLNLKLHIFLFKIHLKAPKEQKLSKGVTVELFPTPGTEFCPIKAYSKWKNYSKLKLKKCKYSLGKIVQKLILEDNLTKI